MDVILVLFEIHCVRNSTVHLTPEFRALLLASGFVLSLLTRLQAPGFSIIDLGLLLIGNFPRDLFWLWSQKYVANHIANVRDLWNYSADRVTQCLHHSLGIVAWRLSSPSSGLFAVFSVASSSAVVEFIPHSQAVSVLLLSEEVANLSLYNALVDAVVLVELLGEVAGVHIDHLGANVHANLWLWDQEETP